MTEHSTSAVTSIPRALHDVIQQARDWVREVGANMAAMVVDGDLSPEQMSSGLEGVRGFIRDATDLAMRWDALSGQLSGAASEEVVLEIVEVTIVSEIPEPAAAPSHTPAPTPEVEAPVAAATPASGSAEKDRFDPAIVQALHLLGGSGTSSQVKDAIEANSIIQHEEGDFEVYGNGKTAWRLAVDRGLTSLRRDGRVAKSENKVWSLIDAGKEVAPPPAPVRESPAPVAAPAPTPTPKAQSETPVAAAKPASGRSEKERFDPSIVKALHLMGGSGTSAEVKDVIEANGLIEHEEGDFEVYGNGKTAWRLAVDRELTSLRRDGRVSKDENKVWTLLDVSKDVTPAAASSHTPAPTAEVEAPVAATTPASGSAEKDRFDPAISKALRLLGGSGTSAQVKDVIEVNGLIEHEEGDFEVYGNGKTAWRLAVDRGLTSLRRDGRVSKDENKVWSLIGA